MKKKLLSFIFAICIVLPCALIMTACGEQYIEERDYQLLGMTVIEDNMPYISAPFESGEYYTTFCGAMVMDKCVVDVKHENLTLEFNDDATGINAVFNFDVYTDNSLYPAYTFKSYSISLGEQDITDLTDQGSLTSEQQDVYIDVKQFSYVCTLGESSIQLITQNQSLLCHIIVSEKNSNSLLFMAMLYGY